MTLLTALLLSAAQPAAAATPTTPPAPLPLREPGAERAAAERAVADVYAVISGPAGRKRDWTRMKGLFTADARLYAIGARGVIGGSVDDYIARSGASLEQVGFTEKELARRVEIYGNLAQVWSSYHGTSSDGTVNIRGINSFQLARQPDGRWLVHSILWQQERPGIGLPADMEAR